jgi:ankyrin repeat protein
VREETSIADVGSTSEAPTIQIDLSAAIGAQFEPSDKTMDFARPGDLSEVLQFAVIRADPPTLKALKRLETEQLDHNLSFYAELLLAVKDGDENCLKGLLRNRPVTDTKVKEILLSTAVREKKRQILPILVDSFDTTDLGKESVQILDMAINVQDFEMVQLIMQNKHKYNLGKSLRLAVTSANREICKYLLAQGAQVNSAGSPGQTPLHIASANGELDLVKLLLEWRAVPEARDKQGRRPIHCAAEFGHTDIVAYLLKITSSAEDVDKKLRTPMFIACAAGWKATAELLISNGCNLLRRDVKSRTMLHAAARKGSTQVVRLLIDAGCPVDEQDEKRKRPLHEAACHGWDMIVDALLQAGARVNKGDRKGETPLQYACKGKNVPDDTVKRLLCNGADPNWPAKKGYTALHIAAKHSNAGVLTLLLDRGANINAQDLDGRTPLHYACRAEANLEPNFSTLLRFGAYPDVQDHTGKTPADYITSPKLRKKIEEITRVTRKEGLEPIESPVAAQLMELTTSESEE